MYRYTCVVKYGKTKHIILVSAETSRVAFYRVVELVPEGVQRVAVSVRRA